MALGLLVSIHPKKNETNTTSEMGAKPHSIGDYLSIRNRLTREHATSHLSGTIQCTVNIVLNTGYVILVIKHLCFRIHNICGSLKVVGIKKQILRFD